ncbi:hypothetical protein A2U01_0051939, partial [Trifolium medium]|nr:hypothetical protein [Trifolium medium]
FSPILPVPSGSIAYPIQHPDQTGAPPVSDSTGRTGRSGPIFKTLVVTLGSTLRAYRAIS